MCVSVTGVVAAARGVAIADYVVATAAVVVAGAGGGHPGVNDAFAYDGADVVARALSPVALPLLSLTLRSSLQTIH